MKVKAHIKPSKQFGMLPEGDHLVRIDEITETFNKDWQLMPWDDKTPQIAIKFKNNKGYITLWVNLKGYMTIEDYEDVHAAELSGVIFKEHPFSKIKFAVDLNNNRIENEQKTLTCLHILGRVAHCGGIPAGNEIETKDLIGLEMLIRVQKVNDNLKVTHTFKRK